MTDKEGDSPKVSVLVLNWNGCKDTVECLRSVEKIQYSNFEIVLIDNGSSDNSVETVQKEFSNVKIIRNSKNLGYAEGNNVGIKYALTNRSKYILILNPREQMRNLPFCGKCRPWIFSFGVDSESCKYFFG